MAKTGETCTMSGHYKFAGHTDGSIGCHPTLNESDILIVKGNTFPPIKSHGKCAYWTHVRPLIFFRFSNNSFKHKVNCCEMIVKQSKK